MAYASQTTDDREHPIRFVIEIHGVEQVRVSDAVSPTSLVSNRTQLKCLLQDSLSFGEERLDVKRRAVTGWLMQANDAAAAPEDVPDPAAAEPVEVMQ